MGQTIELGQRLLEDWGFEFKVGTGAVIEARVTGPYGRGNLVGTGDTIDEARSDLFYKLSEANHRG